MRIAMPRFLTTLTCLMFWCAPYQAQATGYTFTSIDVPSSSFPGLIATDATGINDRGQIVGTSGFSNGFLYDRGNITPIDVPGVPSSTAPAGINNSGQIAGWYIDTTTQALPFRGFLESGGNFTSIDAPGAEFTVANGINDHSQIVGTYNGPSLVSYGFLLSQNSFTTISVPGAAYTQAQGINNSGQIVGSYFLGVGPHGYLYTGNTFTTIDVPGALFTAATGINDLGDIVGWYGDPLGGEHGFLFSANTFTTIDFPDTSASTVANGINNRGQIVGFYIDSFDPLNPFNPSAGQHGFLATRVPEPSSLLLLGVGLAGLLGWQWKRRSSALF